MIRKNTVNRPIIYLVILLLLMFELVACSPAEKQISLKKDSTKTEIIKTVVAGDLNSFILTVDGDVWMWGNNCMGQLGDGTKIDRYYPIKLKSVNNVAGIAKGLGTKLFVKKDGTVWGFSGNDQDELGDSTENDSDMLPMVKGLTNIVAIASGPFHMLALGKDGELWSWGENEDGQLGDGTNDVSNIPHKVKNLKNIVACSANSYSSLALESDGTVWSWGYNQSGQLGDGTNTSRNVPVKVKGLSNIIAISAGNDHSLALDSAGAVWSWGDNPVNAKTNIPIKVKNIEDIISIAAGCNFSLALKSDGTVWSWGGNPFGELGNGTNTDSETPVQVKGLNNIVLISAGTSTAFAVSSDGSVYGWGNNYFGELGDGTNINRNVPVKVQFALERQGDGITEATNWTDVIQTSQTKNQKLIIEDTKYNIKKIEEGKTINNYYFSPDKKNYFVEKNEIGFIEFEPHKGYLIYLNDKKSNCTSGSYTNFEKNLSPVPVLWLNNEEVFIIKENVFEPDLYYFNIKTEKKEVLRNTEEPYNGSEYYNSSYNKKLNKIAIMRDYEYLISTYIYDLSKKTWEYVNKFDVPSTWYSCNCGWDLDDNLYFDTAKGEEGEITSNTIKKYDLKTGKVEDYLKNSMILNISPDGRYMAYIDIDKQKTQIKDLKDNSNITVTLTKELEWNPEKDEFAFMDTLGNSIYTITIENKALRIRKYNINNVVEEGTNLINLQHYNGKIRFDTAKYITIDNEIIEIEKVLTYELEW